MLHPYIEARTIPEPNSGCLLWLPACEVSGYGVAKLNGRKIGAHRASYLLHHGNIGRGLCVCHKCDVPGCVNPDHLFLGSQADNMADRDAKGRHARTYGEAHGRTKLSAADALAIRESTEPQKVVAVRYGISQSQVSRIRAGVRRIHLDQEVA